jgi:Sec-independent protein translocase protein TatA
MGPSHILLILIVILIIVIIWRGPKTLPLIGRAFGQGVKEARKEIDEIKADIDKKSDGGSDAGPTGGSGGTPAT